MYIFYPYPGISKDFVVAYDPNSTDDVDEDDPDDDLDL